MLNETQDEIYSRKIYAGRRTYYLDIKITSKNDKYLVISEKRRTNDRNKVEHDRVMVFREDFEKFFDNMEAIKAWLCEEGEIPSGEKKAAAMELDSSPAEEQ
jgi:hypothetical protein